MSQATIPLPDLGPHNMHDFVDTYINPSLLALLTNSSGASEPASPAQWQLWLDTSTTPKTLRIATGSGWSAIGTVDTTTLVFSPTGVPAATTAIAAETLTRRLDDENVWQALGPEYARNSPFVYDTGEPLSNRADIGTAGAAVPFTWDGTAFNLARFYYSTNTVGADIRVTIWSGNQTTLLATGHATSSLANYAWVRFDKTINTALIAAGVLYFAFDASDGVTHINGHNVPGYKDVADPVTYPQKYVLAGGGYTPNLSAWSAIVGNVGYPVSFRLYNAVQEARHLWGIPGNTPIVTPRFCGMVGMEMNIHFDALRRGQGKKNWFVDTSGVAFGQTLDAKWTHIPTAPVTDFSMRIDCLDLEDPYLSLGHGITSVTVVSATAAASAARKILCIGNSLTASGRPSQRVLDNAVTYPTSVQPTMIGRVVDAGNAANKHEGVSGRTMDLLIDPSSPFHNGTTVFDASYYLSHNSLANPDIVVWDLGPNDVFVTENDVAASGTADHFLQLLDLYIGLTSNPGTILSWKTAVPAAAHLVCIPTPPAFSQDAFGLSYGTAEIRARYCARLAIFQNAILQHYADKEAQKVFLVPYNAVVDPVNGFPYVSVPAFQGSTTTVQRVANGVHPATAAGVPSGYEQMGDCITATINAGVVRGWF